jgi:hypothetical protein
MCKRGWVIESRADPRMYCVGGAVKLSIKSFTVPELFVDLPESASVASLKVVLRSLGSGTVWDNLCLGMQRWCWWDGSCLGNWFEAGCLIVFGVVARG